MNQFFRKLTIWKLIQSAPTTTKGPHFHCVRLFCKPKLQIKCISLDGTELWEPCRQMQSSGQNSAMLSLSYRVTYIEDTHSDCQFAGTYRHLRTRHIQKSACNGANGCDSYICVNWQTDEKTFLSSFVEIRVTRHTDQVTSIAAHNHED